MPTGSEAFLEMPGACELQPCARTHLKKGLVPHSSGWWDGGQIPSSLVFIGALRRSFLSLLFFRFIYLFIFLWDQFFLLFLLRNRLYRPNEHVHVTIGVHWRTLIMNSYFRLRTRRCIPQKQSQTTKRFT